MYRITNYNNWDTREWERITKEIPIPPTGSQYVTVNYRKKTFVDPNINKIGYCCEPLGNSYPIFLDFGNGEQAFYVSKGGMYEFQAEDYTDQSIIESEDEEFPIQTAEVKLKGIAVPEDIKFTLDLANFATES